MGPESATIPVCVPDRRIPHRIHPQERRLTFSRWAVRQCPRLRILFALGDPTLAFFDSYRPPCGRADDLDMLLPRRRGAFPLSCTLAPIPARAPDLHLPDSVGVATRFPSRHPAVRSAYGVGRVDRSGGYHHYRGERGCHLCYEAHPRQSQGKEEADCGKRRHERSKLLCKSYNDCV